MRADRSLLAGVALVCFANLLLEVLVTRIFSATMFYHFTFMAVGLAMFGIAASGVYVFVNEERLAGDVRAHMARNARRFGVTALLALIYTLANPIFTHGDVPVFSGRVIWQMLLLVLFTALPFFYAGVVVSLALTFCREHVERVYFWDLVGAAVAAILCGAILTRVGGPTAELIGVAAALTGAALFDRGRLRWAWPAVGVAMVVVNLAYPAIRVGSVKWEDHIVFEEWNAFSRVTVDSHHTIKIDAGAASIIHDLRTLTPGMYQREISALALATFAPPPDHVLVIGPGGGRDVLFALSGGARKVTGVELNGIIGETIMQERFASASGGLYLDPRVHIVVDEGRSFVRRSDERYDLIQASQVDTWAATGAGAFALSENTLYTIEAFRDYFEHLSDRGVVTMTRFWWPEDSGSTTVPESAAETPRLLILAAGALQTLGVAPRDLRKHLFFAGAAGEPQGTLVAKRTPFTADELGRLEAAARAAGFRVLVSPTTNGSTLLERYIDGGAWSPLVRDATWELTPPTDDRPFFFYFEKFGNLFHPSRRFHDPTLWLMILLSSMFLLSAAFIVAPLVARLVRDGVPARDEPRGLQATVLACFGVVGFSFMAVEIALMQRFSLFLGHPSHALLVILSVVLLSTAGGAWLSGRFPVARLGRVVLVAGLATAVLSTIYGQFLGEVLRSMIGVPLVARVALTAVLVTPCGLLMGALVPSLVRILGDARSPLVPWGWGINGATSVIGTSLATVIAIYAGFTATFLVGAVGYVAAAGLGVRAAAGYTRLRTARAASAAR